MEIASSALPLCLCDPSAIDGGWVMRSLLYLSRYGAHIHLGGAWPPSNRHSREGRCNHAPLACVKRCRDQLGFRRPGRTFASLGSVVAVGYRRRLVCLPLPAVLCGATRLCPRLLIGCCLCGRSHCSYGSAWMVLRGSETGVVRTHSATHLRFVAGREADVGCHAYM